MKFISLNFGRKTSLALLILLFLYYVPFSPVFFCTNEFYVKKVPVTLLISLILLLFLKEKLRIKLGLLLAIFRILFVINVIILILSGIELDWPMFYLFFCFIDFPVFLIYLLLGYLDDLPITYFLVMSGIFGTIWFFCLPLIFSKLIDNIKSPPNVKEQFK